MADMLQTGAAWLAQQRTAHASQTVTYARGGRSVSLAATPAPVRRVDDSQFGILTITERDWLISASLLVLSGAVATPQKNDTITESNGAVWQVLPIEGEPEARHSDPYGYTWRVHAKRIDT